METEKRSYLSEVSVEDAGDGEFHIRGISPVFNQRSEVLYEHGRRFIEVIRPSAVKGVLDNADVRGQYNHEDMLARTKNGTLKLEVFEDGVHYDILVNPEDPEAMSAYAKTKRGDVDGSSFMFSVAQGGDEWVMENGMAVRYVNQIGEFLDVGPVDFPAYPQASASARSKASELQQKTVPAEGQETEAGGEQERQQELMETEVRKLSLLKLKYPNYQ